MSSEANDLSEKEKKSTIMPEHVLAALEQLGFSEFQEDVRAFYGDVKESNAQRGAGRSAWLSPCSYAAMQCRLNHRRRQVSRREAARRHVRSRAACPKQSRRGFVLAYAHVCRQLLVNSL